VIDKAELAKSVPSSHPLASTSGLLFTSAQDKAIGAISGSQSSLDGFIGFAATNDLQTSGSGDDLSGVSIANDRQGWRPQR
jgi:hypothetical protein